MSQQGWRDLLIPVAVAALLFLPSIGQWTLYYSDEARYALIARGMVEHGSWLVPRLEGQIRMEKPPLFMWAIAFLSMLGGGKVTEFTCVLPAALSGIGGVAGTVLLGRRLFGPRAGLFAGLVLATSPEYFWHSRVVFIDMTVTLFVVWSAWAFWRAMDTPQSRRHFMALFYVFVALAVSAKGAHGLMPILLVGAFLLSEEGWKGLRALRPLMGIGILALVSAPWVIAFALQQEKSFVHSVLVMDYFRSYFGSWKNIRDVFLALQPLFIEILPWSLFLPLAVREGYVRADDPEIRRKFRFLLFWVFTYLIVITLMAEKRTRYFIPMYPALALMVGWVWDRWMAGRIRVGSCLYAWLWGGLVAAAAFSLLALLPLRPDLAIFVPPTPGQKLLMIGILIAGGIGGVIAFRANTVGPGVLVLCLTMGLLLLFETQIYVSQYGRTYNVKGFSRTIAAHVRPEDPLVGFRLQFRHLGFDFYLRRTIPDLQDPKEWIDQLRGSRPIYFLADERMWRALEAATGRTWPVVERADFGGRIVFLGTNTPDAPSRSPEPPEWLRGTR